MSDFFSLNDIAVTIWTSLILSVFFIYCSCQDFAKVTMKHLLCMSLLCTCMGCITGIFIMEFGFIPFVFGLIKCFKTGVYYLTEYPIKSMLLLAAYLLIILNVHFVATRSKSPCLSKTVAVMLLIGMFLLGVSIFFQLFPKVF